jgi:hypothetical protein
VRSRLVRQLRAIPEKPLDVVAFRARQEVVLAALDRTRGWPLVSRRARASALSTGRSDRPVTWVAPGGRAAVLAACAAGAITDDDIDGPAGVVAERAFPVLAATCPAPTAGHLPWHTDWRFGHTWPPAPFRSYDFYTPRQRAEPYDIRFVWELNRLGWILPLAQAVALGRDADGAHRRDLHDTLRSWSAHNPLARSSSWQPMEASMRLVNLCSLVGLLGCGGALRPDDASLLLPMIAEHGAFVWRTREFTDVRGNHYAANVVALLLAGLVLGDRNRAARRWVAFGEKALGEEIAGQLHDDGVDIEGSLAYHGLVTHLFLTAILALEQAGRQVPAEADERVHRAARYLADSVRADGALPAVGDDDGASAVDLDAGRRLPWHSVLAIAAHRWSDPDCVAPGVATTPATLWALGPAALTPLPAGRGAPMARHYPAGGVVVARSGGTSFWMDVGEVGLGGRGGHGHNDLGSFDLALEGEPFVVDRGSYLYTGDLDARDVFRGTASHTSLVVDGEEIAPLVGPWGIAPGAEPTGVGVSITDGAVVATVGHKGYGRLPDPVHVSRTVRVDLGRGRLHCADRITAAHSHVVERGIHLAAGAVVELRSQGADVELPGQGGVGSVAWDDTSEASVAQVWTSTKYGQRELAPTIVLRSDCRGGAELWFELSSADPPLLP